MENDSGWSNARRFIYWTSSADNIVFRSEADSTKVAFDSKAIASSQLRRKGNEPLVTKDVAAYLQQWYDMETQSIEG